MAGAKNSKASRATSRRKLPPRAARKKRVLEEPTSAKVNPKSMARNKIKIADLSEERQIVVRKQNQIATAKKRLQGGEDLKVAENKSAVDRYVMKTVIVSIVVEWKGEDGACCLLHLSLRSHDAPVICPLFVSLFPSAKSE